MRDKDIKNLLAHVEKSLVNIKNTYDQSLHDQTICGPLAYKKER